MLITGQQKIVLNNWQKGLINNTDLYNFLAGRSHEIPYNLRKNGSDRECIEYCIKTAKVFTNPHKVINFFASLPYNRLEYRKRLRNL